MFRVVLQIVVPLLLPVAIYAVGSYWTSLRQGKGRLPGWEEGHWFWVIALGVVLAFGSIGFLTWSGGRPGEIYVPPHVEDGRMVPGELRPREND
jgi:hypothetical protein